MPPTMTPAARRRRPHRWALTTAPDRDIVTRRRNPATPLSGVVRLVVSGAGHRFGLRTAARFGRGRTAGSVRGDASAERRGAEPDAAAPDLEPGVEVLQPPVRADQRAGLSLATVRLLGVLDERFQVEVRDVGRLHHPTELDVVPREVRVFDVGSVPVLEVVAATTSS